MNAFDTNLIISLSPTICRILRTSRFSQIFESIVSRINISVIQQSNRPNPMNVKPRQTVTFIPFTIKPDLNSTFTVISPYFRTR